MDEEESNTNRPKEDKDADTELKDKSGIVLSPRPQAIIGAVPGVPVGTLFGNRIHLRFAGVHRPPMAGICGNPQRGAESIVLNSGYEDDVDEGDTIVYTGAGGNQGGKQVADQELTGTNAALVKSEELDLPVRVVRGSKLKSDFAAPYGFRYDGLYKVVEHYKTVGTSGFAVWQFKMTREPDQPELPGRMSEKERLVLAKKLKKQFEPILRDLRSIHMAGDGESKVKSERGVKSEKKVKREVKRERDEIDDFDGIDPDLIQPRKRRRTIGGEFDSMVKQEKRRRGPGQPLPYQYRGYPGQKLSTLPTWKLVSIILRGYCPLCVKLLFNCDVPVLHINQNNYLELASVLDHARLTKAINHLIEHQMYIRDLALHVEKNAEVDPLEQLMSQHIMNQMRVRSFIEGLGDDKDYSYILEAEKPVVMMPQDEEVPSSASPVAEPPLPNVNNEESVKASQPAEDVQYLFTNDQNVVPDYYNELDGLMEKQSEMLGSEPVRALETPRKPKFTTEVINVIDDESDNNNNIVIVDGYTLFVSNKYDQNQLKKSAGSAKTTNNNKQPNPANTNNNVAPSSSRQPASNLSLYDVIVVDDDDEFAYQNKLIEEISSDEEADNATVSNSMSNKVNGAYNNMLKKSQEKQANGTNGSSDNVSGSNGHNSHNNLPNNNVNRTESLFQLDNIVMDDD